MFNSRDSKFRSPSGAVATDTSVHFKIMLPRELGCSAALLLTEKERGESSCNNMFWCGMEEDSHEWWECHFTPNETGLYFYYFEIKTAQGHRQLSRGFGSEAVFGGHDRWQLTVYDKDFTTPSWLEGGIIYQIFPDRFCFSGEEKQNLPYGRKIHENWGEIPDWKPNDDGKITNSDYFRGDFKGVEQKLDYIKSLGTTCIYFNPIFEAHSNHRYDTANYSKIDPLLGTEEDFVSLCKSAGKLGIKIILDGVFSHTGSDSIYFNRENRYNSLGAYNSQSSEFYSWYSFKNWPDDYESWWNFITLPNVNETNTAFDNYINGENGIIRRWLKLGAAGWRLDVVDELPDQFIDNLSRAAKTEKADALILGEVWEDASNKTAYGIRRRYFLGGQLDSVMNYPFRNAILGFLLGENKCNFVEIVESIIENYPAQSLNLLMNHIGTHDTERAITILGGEPVLNNDRQWQYEHHKLSDEQRTLGIKRLKLAALLQFTLPGVPSVYYGDEAGVEGYKDPFNRACYPWGNENSELIEWYRNLGKLRKNEAVFANGTMNFITANADLTNTDSVSTDIIAYERADSGETLRIIINRSDRECATNNLIPENGEYIFGSSLTENKMLPPYGCTVIKFTK